MVAGVSPKDLAPSLFSSARFKTRSIHTELRNCNWIKSLADINSSSQIEEFTLLFMALSSITLTDQDDKIT
jgi:hypothetical protein